MSFSHPLDRPIWSALTGRQAHLALREGDAVRIQPDVGIFAAARDEAALPELTILTDRHPGAGFLEAEGSPMAGVLPVGAQIAMQAALAQMVATQIAPGPAVDWTPLGEADAEDIHALALMTRPGPFRPRTFAFGGFIGVKDQGRLVAMAGTRLRVEGYSELSAVCTHPDWRGKGLAKGLMRVVGQRLLDEGDAVFLHAFADHAATIAMYRSLGFELRQRIRYTVLAG